MQTHKDYVAGWLSSSIHDFLDTLPIPFESMKYALVTCLDSNFELNGLLEASPELRAMSTKPRVLGTGLLLPTTLLLQTDRSAQIFFGFDEVWFFPSEKISRKPDNTSLVGPSRIDHEKLDHLYVWMMENSCSLGLGDGDGLNFVVKARGLLKHLLGHSIDQHEPHVAFETSPVRAVAG